MLEFFLGGEKIYVSFGWEILKKLGITIEHTIRLDKYQDHAFQKHLQKELVQI